MSIDVLISTMNLFTNKQYNDLLKNMNIKNNSVVINQCPGSDKLLNLSNDKNNRIYSYSNKGLSISRNNAISKSKADICILADDDLRYNENYQQIVLNAYEKYPEADLIAFYVSSDNPNNVKPKLSFGKVGLLKSFKIQSVQLTFRRDKIQEKNIKFDELFGAGTELYMGEENIFIFDCIKSGLHLYSYPVEFAKLNNRESSWFKGYDEKYFQVKSACFYRMSKFFWLFLCIQFIVRKYKIYKKDISSFKALKNMVIGKNNYKTICSYMSIKEQKNK